MSRQLRSGEATTNTVLRSVSTDIRFIEEETSVPVVRGRPRAGSLAWFKRVLLPKPKQQRKDSLFSDVEHSTDDCVLLAQKLSSKADASTTSWMESKGGKQRPVQKSRSKANKVNAVSTLVRYMSKPSLQRPETLDIAELDEDEKIEEEQKNSILEDTLTSSTKIRGFIHEINDSSGDFSKMRDLLEKGLITDEKEQLKLLEPSEEYKRQHQNDSSGPSRKYSSQSREVKHSRNIPSL